jgi:hypothetical protein
MLQHAHVRPSWNHSPLCAEHTAVLLHPLLRVAVLQALQLVSCRNVRNRDLFVLANGVHVKAGQQVPAQEDVAMQVQEEQEAEAVVPGAEGVHYDIQLTSLVLGDDTNKPWVTNRCGIVPTVLAAVSFGCPRSQFGTNLQVSSACACW